MGAGSTIAAAEAVGLLSFGVERHLDYYEMSYTAIPQLSAISDRLEHRQLQVGLWEE